MKRLLLSTILSCTLFGQVSARFAEGDLFQGLRDQLIITALGAGVGAALYAPFKMIKDRLCSVPEHRALPSDILCRGAGGGIAAATILTAYGGLKTIIIGREHIGSYHGLGMLIGAIVTPRILIACGEYCFGRRAATDRQ